ncbi:MAG: hypothetical protein HRT68_16965, partial [Flavobacteriaceae bacterium]|nr:hypothetical protein [Flavobacteriaceae bacterium]
NYNENNRLNKLITEYYNDAPFTNDDSYFEPTENRIQTKIYFYEKYDFLEDSIHTQKPSYIGRRYREISYKTFNSKQLLLDSTIIKYRRMGSYGQDIEVNHFTTFFNYNEYPDPTYRIFETYDRNERLTYMEHDNSEPERAPNVIRLYKYPNWKTVNVHKIIEIYKGKSIEIKIYENDSKGNTIKKSKSDLNGNLEIIKEFEYKYDQYDNWIEKVEYDKKHNNIFVYTRDIEYY